MKRKWILVLAILILPAGALSAFDFQLGASVLYDSPILSGGTYNSEFAYSGKAVGIDDFTFGITGRLHWEWFQIDIMAMYNPSGGYNALIIDPQTATLEELEAARNIHHHMDLLINPEFSADLWIFRISFGPGVNMSFDFTDVAAGRPAAEWFDWGLNVKGNFDINIGPVGISLHYIWLMNFDFTEEAVLNNEVFDVDRTLGQLGLSVLYTF